MSLEMITVKNEASELFQHLKPWMGLEEVLLLMVQKSGVHQLRLVVYPTIYRVLYIPGGCLGFQPSTVVSFFGCRPFSVKYPKGSSQAPFFRDCI